MSALAPLYLAGLLALALPVLFHLIRRTPQGRLPFSTLMFLSPSPPRLTRRSRLDNLLLLLLRAAALALLAAAFARPFLRDLLSLGIADQGGRRTAILVDTSASMRREGVWPAAVAAVEDVLRDLGPGDDVALYRFDSRLEPLVGFDEAPPLEPAVKAASVKASLNGDSPGWGASRLGEALIAVAEEVQQAVDDRRDAARTERQIVLVTDLQEGGRIEELRTYDWPSDVLLTVRKVAPRAATNAGLTLGLEGEVAKVAETESVPVRVWNDRGSQGDQFQLRWQAGDGPAADAEPVSVYVPRGESRLVRVPGKPGTAGRERLVLSGDDHDFDNTLYLTPTTQEELAVGFLGADQPDDPAGLRYYAERAFAETPARKVRWIAPPAGERVEAAALKTVPLAICVSPPAGRVSALRDYLRGGGTLLVVLTETADPAALGGLLNKTGLRFEEAGDREYAMLGSIDFRDPLFAPLADPQYNDFTKIHFWRHRRLPAASVADLRVLARFDDGDPALVEQSQGDGRLLVLAAGWHPADSELARSTKFVPLLSALLESCLARQTVRPQYRVGDRVPLPPGDSDRPLRVRLPGGEELPLAAGAEVFDATDQPGIYALVTAESVQPFAVNLAEEESRTDAREADELQEYGVRMADRPTREEIAERLRPMRDMELERRQKFWQWLVAAAAAVLVTETWLAGYLTRFAAAAGAAGERRQAGEPEA